MTSAEIRELEALRDDCDRYGQSRAISDVVVLLDAIIRRAQAEEIDAEMARHSVEGKGFPPAPGGEAPTGGEQAGAWRGPMRCDKCNWDSTMSGYTDHARARPGCTGKLIPWERRASRPDSGLVSICRCIVKDQHKLEVLPSLIAELAYELELYSGDGAAEPGEALSLLEEVTDLYAALFKDTYPDLDPENVASIRAARAALSPKEEM